MHIYFATWLLEETQGIALTKKQAAKRLVSFFHIKEKKKQFKTYIKTGKNKRNIP